MSTGFWQQFFTRARLAHTRLSTFSVCDLIEAVLRTKSHKAENWYEMYHAVRIDRTEGTVFLDVDFDYGS